jgi:transposase-like protein
VDIDDVSATRVTVMRGIADTTGAKQKPKQKLVVKCPHCNAENDVRV